MSLRTRGPTTRITIDSPNTQSPYTTPSHSTSNSRSNSFSEGSSGHLHYSDDIEPSESASRPRAATRYIGREQISSREQSTSRPPPVERTHTISRAIAEATLLNPPLLMVVGRTAPPPSYAPSAYSTGPNGTSYAPPFGNPGIAPPPGPGPGALTHYGGGYPQQYNQGSNPFAPQSPNSFAPQPSPSPGGASYFKQP
ncbi:hypothetical protein DID88_010077 [Monilinia fructigena]|uniref:Uncharacterized protein n=1 Tax=Monilinia fructigena TaxID=38457 RepID=A0A395ILF5_9HELO|nr:hypothetical protein DID88_010077 [Monilinia fructigena]